MVAVSLMVAMGTAACSSTPASPGTSLPITVQTGGQIVHPSGCILNSSGTQVTATGTFDPPYSLPVDAFGQKESRFLQLNLLTSHERLNGQDAETGGTESGISVGETSWHVVATVQGAFRPTRCVVDLVPLA